MSKDIAKAYQEFLKKDQKRKNKMKDRMSVSSTGLLAPRMPRNKQASDTADSFSTMYSLVDEIRKYGGKKNETNA